MTGPEVIKHLGYILLREIEMVELRLWHGYVITPYDILANASGECSYSGMHVEIRAWLSNYIHMNIMGCDLKKPSHNLYLTILM